MDKKERKEPVAEEINEYVLVLINLSFKRSDKK